MKIYFASSIRGGREDAALYMQLINYLKKYGEVLTEHVGDSALTELGDDGVSDQFIHDRDLEWLQSADVVVAEVSITSMGVGYEIGRAIEAGKKVLCLFRPEKCISAMIAGCPDIILENYKSVSEAETAIDTFMKY